MDELRRRLELAVLRAEQRRQNELMRRLLGNQVELARRLRRVRGDLEEIQAVMRAVCVVVVRDAMRREEPPRWGPN